MTLMSKPETASSGEQDGLKQASPSDPQSIELEETLELFRKQCINKGGGIGFEETKVRLSALLVKSRRQAILEATGGMSFNMPMRSMRTRNTAFKKYAVKYFNSTIEKRSARMLTALQSGETNA